MKSQPQEALPPADKTEDFGTFDCSFGTNGWTKTAERTDKREWWNRWSVRAYGNACALSERTRLQAQIEELRIILRDVSTECTCSVRLSVALQLRVRAALLPADPK